MGDVISLKPHKKIPYIRDEAICPNCCATWIAVIPDTIPHVILCPTCGSSNPVWIKSLRAIEDKKILTCGNCGSQAYYVTETSNICVKCGKESMINP